MESNLTEDDIVNSCLDLETSNNLIAKFTDEEEQHDSDETFCDLSDNHTNQNDFQNVNDNSCQNNQQYEHLINEELVESSENMLQMLDIDSEEYSRFENMLHGSFICEQDYLFSELTLFDKQHSDEIKQSNLLLPAVGLLTDIVDEISTIKPQVVDRESSTLESTYLKGSAEDFIQIFENKLSLQSNFVNDEIKTKVIKPCSPPLTINTTFPNRKRKLSAKQIPNKRLRKLNPKGKMLPVRKCSSRYLKTRFREVEPNITETEPIRMFETKVTKEKRKCNKKIENKENLDNYQAAPNHSAPILPTTKCSKRGRKKKNLLKEENFEEKGSYKMELEEIEENINDIKTKANLWLCGLGYHPSRDEAFLMLEKTQQLINTLETFHKKSLNKIRLLEIAKKLASAIDIAISESDQLMYSEISELETCVEDCTNEGGDFRTMNDRSVTNLKSILKQKNSVKVAESEKKHIHFSEECQYISTESFHQNSYTSDGSNTEENPVSTEEDHLMECSEEGFDEHHIEYDSDRTELGSDTDIAMCNEVFMRQNKEKEQFVTPESSMSLSKKSSTDKKEIFLEYKNALVEKEYGTCSNTSTSSFSSTQALRKKFAIQSSTVGVNLEKCNPTKEQIDVSGAILGNNYGESSNCVTEELSESILCPSSRHTPPKNDVDKTNTCSEATNINSTESEINEALLQSNNSVISKEQKPPEEPEPWTKITLMSVKAVRIKDPAEFIPISSLPKNMLEGNDWFFD